MGLAAGELPDIVLFLSGETAFFQGLHSSLPVVLHRIVHAGVGGVVQHGRADDLVFKILVHIAHLPGQCPDIRLSRLHAGRLHAPLEISCDKVGDQAVHDLAECGLSAAVISDDCHKISLLYLQVHTF